MSSENAASATPVHDLVLLHLHVAWNEEDGQPNRLTAIEFGDDCEICAVETDVLDGDPVYVAGDAFLVCDSESHREARLGKRFRFRKRFTHVGNVMWDLLLMTPDELGRFAEHIQRQKNWSLHVADQAIWNSWGSLSGPNFVEMIKELSQ